MKVVLLQDVKKVGRRYDVIDVSDGHALNFLIPNGLAIEATPKAITQAMKNKSNAQTSKEISIELLKKNFKDLSGIKISLSGKASDKGHLFASISEKDIAEAIRKQTPHNIHPDLIKLPHHIKTTGEHEVVLQSGDVETTIIVTVSAE